MPPENTTKDVNWSHLALAGTDDADALREEVAPLLEDLHPASLDHDPHWLAANAAHDSVEAQAVLGRIGDRAVAYAPFVLTETAIPFSLGEVTYFRHSVTQLQLSSGAVLEVPSESHADQLAESLFSYLAEQLESGEILYLLGVPLRSPLYRALSGTSEISSRFHVLPHGNPVRRRLIRLPSSYEGYLSQLGKKTRSHLRQYERRLREHTGGRVEARAYHGPGSETEFLERAVPVSARTYQWKLLGRGLKDRARKETLYGEMARRGWLRCYTLECEGDPVAFMAGYLYRGRYYCADVGYDPEWTEWSVGHVLHSAVVRDLINTPNAEFFDFMGDRPNQERLSNDTYVEEAAFYLIPRSLRGGMLAAVMRTADAGARFVARTLSKLGLKRRIRRWIRRRAVSSET